MPRKKLTEKQLILKRIIEKGIKDWDDDPDYDRIINPERGWDSDFKRYYIYVDAKEFSDSGMLWTIYTVQAFLMTGMTSISDLCRWEA